LAKMRSSFLGRSDFQDDAVVGRPSLEQGLVDVNWVAPPDASSRHLQRRARRARVHGGRTPTLAQSITYLSG